MTSRFADSSALPALGTTIAGGAGNSHERLEAEVVALFDELRDPLFRYLVGFGLVIADGYRAHRDAERRTESEADDLAVEPGLNPEDQVVRGQTQQRLQAVVQALPEQDRLCLFLRAEGLRYREIAGILDMSLGTVSISLARIARTAER